jgi:hypothetical protein
LNKLNLDHETFEFEITAEEYSTAILTGRLPTSNYLPPLRPSPGWRQLKAHHGSYRFCSGLGGVSPKLWPHLSQPLEKTRRLSVLADGDDHAPSQWAIAFLFI